MPRLFIPNTTNAETALALLATLSDKPVQVVDIQQLAALPITSYFGAYLGANKETQSNFIVYLNQSYPERIQEAVFFHEVLHLLLKYEGFPQITINLSIGSTCRSNLLDSLVKLRIHFASVIDHHIVFPRMRQLIGFDLSEYFDVQVNQKQVRLDRAWEPNTVIRNFYAQQDILIGLEYFLYPEPQRSCILRVFKSKNPGAYASVEDLQEKVSQTAVITPKELFDIAKQIKSHIIKYGGKKAISHLNVMWKALDIKLTSTRPTRNSIMVSHMCSIED
jgi:hypothetical protein